MSGEDRHAETVVERHAPAPEAVPAPAPAVGPVEGSVLGLSRGAGNAAVAGALGSDEPPPSMIALAARARARRRDVPLVADEAAPPVATGDGEPPDTPDGDGLGAGFREALRQRPAPR